LSIETVFAFAGAAGDAFCAVPGNTAAARMIAVAAPSPAATNALRIVFVTGMTRYLLKAFCHDTTAAVTAVAPYEEGLGARGTYSRRPRGFACDRLTPEL
jgi:hypothetical protein